jgi:hypothetical protein
MSDSILSTILAERDCGEGCWVALILESGAHAPNGLCLLQGLDRSPR